MDKIIKSLLENKAPGGNIFPFLWVHGEPEETIREYMEAVYNANLRAVCVESRPHPDYAGPRWWHDMDIILDEARKRGMKVWILDDSHFPTGYANGAVEQAPARLCRQSVLRKTLGRARAGENAAFSEKDCLELPEWNKNLMEQYVIDPSKLRSFDDDRLAGVVAVPVDGGEILELPVEDGVVRFTPETGEWELYSLIFTRNRGPHRNYINMMDRESCRLLIDAVYEPHWRHYQADFGKTIAGFFSDEPELGNGHLYGGGLRIWEEEDLAWSAPLESMLREKWGSGFAVNLFLLWGNSRPGPETWQARQDYMDSVTRLVQENFSRQVGDWCREHGVEYIGHLIEDNNQHTRTACGLGHFFRCLSGQDMAGIDDIGGQVLPQGEEISAKGLTGETRNGPFFHYVLGRLGASLAAIDPLKKGRCMCEVFGAYGWQEGVKLEKYLADHFMVRGVNRFVPHAFSMKDYPDPDCPPHFYAHGHNPQYRHFGRLMAYMERVTALLSGGACVPDVAVLYPAESDWAGEAMTLEQVAKPLAERQVAYDFIPADVFTEREKYRTSMESGFSVNGQRYKALVLLDAETLPQAAADALPELEAAGCRIVKAGELDQVEASVTLAPAAPLMRVLRYRGETERYFIVNEGAEAYTGEIILPASGPCYAYNAWDNRLETVAVNGSALQVRVEPGKSLMVLFDTPDVPLAEPIPTVGRREPLNDGWLRGVCRAVDYPDFKDEKAVALPDTLAEEEPEFSGFVRYRRQLECAGPEARVVLEITQAYEGVEVFVNGESLGIQIAAPFRYDLTGRLNAGANQLEIQVATTLERENYKNADPMMAAMGFGSGEPKDPSGISGEVALIYPGIE